MLRRTAVRIAAVLAAMLIVVSCARTGADEQTRSAGQLGYPTVPRNLTRIPPEQRKELPIVSGLQAASVETKDTAQFIGITSKDYDPAPAEAFVRSFQITYPSIYDPNGKVLLAFAGELPPSAIPSTMIIDRQGRLAVRVLSEVSKITLVDMINDVAAGR